ncbi:SLATT domain-containing protein [Rhodococcus sp. ARC_M6]|uniref:SLATT domain-containing protein n=1 Tax=Rhodococcus sp. ARC_M6 TaxID=2928852 RepID=UPI001FB33FBE|nr:SLATT domain-containing protein [Rhodococcus sp. ARC_M6]MCJ0906104.1 SLATT domain-containing protein [Rhodococcus sp. ARC_M6]
MTTSWLSDLENRSYRTYKARVHAENRLRTRGHVWNSVLISTTTGTTIAGISLLADPKIFGNAGAAIFASASVATLVASLVITGRNYEGRARDMFDNYRKIQRLSATVELLNKPGDSDTEPESVTRSHTRDNKGNIELSSLFEKYQNLLDESENHTVADSLLSQSGHKCANINTVSQGVVTYAPLAILMLPILILTKLTFWAF